MYEFYLKLVLIFIGCLGIYCFTRAIAETISEAFSKGRINYFKTFIVNFFGRFLPSLGVLGVPVMFLLLCCVAAYGVCFWHYLGKHDNYTGTGTIICYDICETNSYERFYGNLYEQKNIHYYACIKSENDERHIVEISPKTYKQSKIFNNIETKNGVEIDFIPVIDKDINYYLKNDPAATNTPISINSCNGRTIGFKGTRGPSVNGVMRMRINGHRGY